MSIICGRAGMCPRLLLFCILTATIHVACSDRPSETANKQHSVLHLETFVLNLADPNERAYLRVGIDLGLQRAVAENDGPPVALVRDTVLSVLAVAKPDEVLTPQGKAKLKADILRALQERVPQLQIQDVYFTEFLIQR
ncbi:MAG TPA: flagellar basal body-associated FliL family protein [Terriglobales bacterium]